MNDFFQNNILLKKKKKERRPEKQTQNYDDPIIFSNYPTKIRNFISNPISTLTSWKQGRKKIEVLDSPWRDTLEPFCETEETLINNITPKERRQPSATTPP